MIIKLLVIFAVFCALLYILNKVMPDFHLEMGAIPIVGLILVGVNYAIMWTAGLLNLVTLSIVKGILNFISLGLFGLLAGFILNIIVFYLADRLTDRLTIKSTKTLLVSAAALQFTSFLLNKVLLRFL
ncbi:MAG: hypothetical protein U1F27_04285 [Turneriella sp.]